jgi:hypothetical protein
MVVLGLVMQIGRCLVEQVLVARVYRLLVLKVGALKVLLGRELHVLGKRSLLQAADILRCLVDADLILGIVFARYWF